jgi:hypothetical protein
MTDTPWYLRTVDPGAEITDPERKRRHLESLADTASAEADAMVTHLKAAEAQGVEITPSMRLSMGYAQTARKAADLLGDAPRHKPSVTDGDMTPEQRMARGYGSAN